MFTERYAITQNDIDNGQVVNQTFGTGETPPNSPPLPPTPSCDPDKADCQETCTPLPGTPDMEIIKEDQLVDNGDGVGSIGDQIIYTITVTNTGTVTLTNVEVDDPLLGTTEMIPTLAVGQIYVYTEIYDVTQNDIDNGIVINQAFGTGDVPPGVPPLEEVPSDDPKTPEDPKDPNETPLAGQGRISIEKSSLLLDNGIVGTAEANVDQIEYTFTVRNTGTVTLTDVEVVDPLFGTGVLSTIPTLLVNEAFTFKETYTVTQNDVDNGEVVNQAVATGNPPSGPPVTDDSDDPKDLENEDPNNDGDPDDPTVELLPGASKIQIDKDGQLIDNAPLGVADPTDQIRYSFVVRNLGTVTLMDVEVTDPLLGTGVIETIGTLPVNGEYRFTEVYTITQNDINLGEVRIKQLLRVTHQVDLQ